MAREPQPPRADAITGVIAHGLLNSVAAAQNVISTLRRPDLTPEVQDELLRIAERQLAFVSEMLRELVLGLPEGATELLDQLGMRDA